MNELTKKIAIVIGVSFVLFSLLLISYFLYDNNIQNYTANHPRQEGSLEPIDQPEGVFFILWRIFTIINFYVLPIFVVVIGAIYVYNNYFSSGYFKSILIPIFYFIFEFIFYLVFAYAANFQGEDNMAGLFLLGQFGIIFVSSLIVNLVILLFRKK